MRTEPIDTDAVRARYERPGHPDYDECVDGQILALCDALDAVRTQLEQRNRDVNDTGEELFTAVETNRRLQAELTAARAREAALREALVKISGDEEDDLYESRFHEDGIHVSSECRFCHMEKGDPHRKSCTWATSRDALSRVEQS